MQTELTETEQYSQLYQQYQWLHAVVCILIEQEGGAIELPAEVLENYDLRGSLQISNDPERNVYTVEVLPAVEAIDGNA